MKRLIVAAIVLLSVPFALASVAQAGDPGTPHFPDLQTLPPSQLKLTRDRATGQRTLRFSNTVANLGDGVFELRPAHDPLTGTTLAYQRVYTHDAGGAWSLYSETAAGVFTFHLLHDHWHVNDFALYELRNVAPDGSIGSTVLATGGKITFCIMDTSSVQSSLEHSTGRIYKTCGGQNDTQGLSVGWADTYTWNLPGQSLDVTNVPTGTYYLVSTADPDNLFAETNDANNTAAVKVSIKGNTAKVVP